VTGGSGLKTLCFLRGAGSLLECSPIPLGRKYQGSGTDFDVVLHRGAGAYICGVGRGRAGSPRYWTWALLMRRAFDLDVLSALLGRADHVIE
jgi:hypothetical protein